MELVSIGKVINVRGLKGELKIDSLTDFSALRYKKGNRIILEDETNNQVFEFTVKNYFNDGRFDYVQFEEINDVDKAREYLGFYLKINVDTTKIKDKNSFYYHQLVGCDVIDHNNRLIGVVEKVEDIGPHHILRIKTDFKKNDILVPFLWQFLENVDVKKRQIKLKEVEGLI